MAIVIPKKSKVKKGLPKRVGRSGYKARYERYQTRSTCIACGKIFRSPRYRLMHVESGHVSHVGWNEKRIRTGSLI